MTARIRAATVDDADELARLRWDFRIEHGTPASVAFEAFVEEMRAFVSDVLSDGTAWRAWVAEDVGRLVGCTWIQIVERLPHPNLRRGERPIAYVTGMYVEPGLRDGGLGRALLDTAVAFARDLSASAAILWPSARSVPFYRRAGFGRDEAPLILSIEGD